MDDAKREALKAAGIDVEDAVRRFMGKEELMMKFLLRFGRCARRWRRGTQPGLMRPPMRSRAWRETSPCALCLPEAASLWTACAPAICSRQRPVSPLWRRATGRFWTPSDKEK